MNTRVITDQLSGCGVEPEWSTVRQVVPSGRRRLSAHQSLPNPIGNPAKCCTMLLVARLGVYQRDEGVSAAAAAGRAHTSTARACTWCRLCCGCSCTCGVTHRPRTVSRTPCTTSWTAGVPPVHHVRDPYARGVKLPQLCQEALRTHGSRATGRARRSCRTTPGTGPAAIPGRLRGAYRLLQPLGRAGPRVPGPTAASTSPR